MRFSTFYDELRLNEFLTISIIYLGNPGLKKRRLKLV